MSPTFSSLKIRNYRIYATGSLLSNVGTWMGRVAQDWLVLTQLTQHSSSALGLVTGLQFLPFLLLAPVTGMIADRFSKRTILICTQSFLAVSTLVLAVMTLTGVVALWHVYVFALLSGIATAVDNPARQTFVSEMVPLSQLGNAVALNSASFNAGRLVGPGVAGLLIAGFGTGYALLLNGLSFFFVIASLVLVRTRDLTAAPRSRGRRQVREGLAYVRGRPDLMLIMALVFVLGTFGMNFQLTTALMATKEFHKGATEYGLLGSVLAIGSLVAALLAARRKNLRLRVLLVALAGFTLFSGLAALAPGYVVFALVLIPIGLCTMTALTAANTMVQLSVEPVMRGRVMALYMAIFLGGTPLGSPVIGWLGDVAGARWTIGVGTVAVGLSLVAVAIFFRERENLRVSYRPSRRPRLRVTMEQREPAGRGHDARAGPMSVRFRQRVTLAALLLLIALAVVAALLR